jgi:hypothetical protein
VVLEGAACDGDGIATFRWTLTTDGVLAREHSVCPVPVPPEVLRDVIAVDPFKPAPSVFVRDGGVWRCRETDGARPWKLAGYVSTIWAKDGYRGLAPPEKFVAATFMRSPGRATLLALTAARVGFAFDSSSGVGEPIAGGHPVPGLADIVRVGGEAARVVEDAVTITTVAGKTKYGVGNVRWRTPRVVVLEDGATYGWTSSGWARKAG